MRLSARAPGRPSTIITAAPDWTVSQLKSAVEDALGVPAASQTLRAGFPPQALPGSDSGVTLAALGLADGEVIVVEQRGGVISSTQERAPKQTELAVGGYHGSEADVARQGRQAVAATTAALDSATGFRVGDRALYRGREQLVTIEGQDVPVDADQVVTIVSISTDGLQAGEEPMVAVRLPSGTIRDTTFNRLSAYRPQHVGGEDFAPPPSTAVS